MTATNDESRLDRIERILEAVATDLQQTAAIAQRAMQIAESNARSIQAWETRIEDNKVEAEEERSVLRVNVNNLSAAMIQFRVDMDELRQASRENIAQHFDFRERFDRIQERLDRE